MTSLRLKLHKSFQKLLSLSKRRIAEEDDADDHTKQQRTIAAAGMQLKTDAQCTKTTANFRSCSRLWRATGFPCVPASALLHYPTPNRAPNSEPVVSVGT